MLITSGQQWFPYTATHFPRDDEAEWLMPLKCLRGEREIYAFDVETDEAWEGLRKENAETKALRMPCCGAAMAVNRTSLSCACR